MPRHTRIRMAASAGFVALALATLAACSSGVAQKDYDAVKQQLAAKEQEVTKLQQEAQGRGTGTGPTATALREQLAAKEAEVAALKKAAEEAKGVRPLVWTKVGPTLAPPPTATPRPPGFVAPTPAPPDAATVNAVFPFTFYVETLTGHQVSNLIQSPSCVLNAQFQRETHLVWRFEVFDTSTGKRLTSLDSPTVKVVLENGEELTARFARKAGTGPWTWVTAWDVPKDYPLGALDYTIQVTSKDGSRKGTFDPKLATLNSDNNTRGIDQRVQIVQ